MQSHVFLGASACVELGLYDEAIAWCDKGLAVSFYVMLYMPIVTAFD